MGDNPTIAVQTTTVAAATDFSSYSHPYFISQIDSPGTLLVNTPFDEKSFARWKRGMMIVLTAKNESGFIDGSTSEPAKCTDHHKAWSRANNMMISWLLNSLSREISDCVIYSSTAKELWSDLETRFGQSSGAKLFQLQKNLNELVQGTSNIATYYTKMKGLWDELDTLDTFTVCGCACSCGAKEKNVKAKYDVRLVQFLMGLNDFYCVARGNILMISFLPSTANAYDLLIQEEKQREMNMNPKFSRENSSFVALGQNTSGQRPGAPEYKPARGSYNENKKSAPTCRYCKKIRHIIDQCYKIHGFPPNFKFTKHKNNSNKT